MNTKYCYYYFTGALSSKFCDEVIKYASQKQEKKKKNYIKKESRM